jgi:ribulose-5-phosphate 4-epimerase/fuculose-1-phosphate aldolase
MSQSVSSFETQEEFRLRESICFVGNSLFDRGYVHATAGNISVKLEDGYLITPTDACLGQLDPAKLAKVDLSGRHVSGDRPSKTLALHCQIYESTRAAENKTKCVIHTHSTHCVALSLNPALVQTSLGPELLPPLTPYFVMKVGHVPLLPYFRPGDPQASEFAGRVIERYLQDAKPIRALMLQRLGPNVWHESPEKAMAVLEELEETARLCLLAKATPLDPIQIADLRSNFNAVW